MNKSIHEDYERVITDLEQNVDKAHKGLVRDAVFEAASYASNNLPAKNAPSIEPFLTSIKGKYRALKKTVSIKLQAGVQGILGSASVATLNEALKTRGEDIKNWKAQIANMELDKSRVDPKFSSKDHNWKRILLFLFALAESFLNISSFLKLGDILIISATVGGIVGIAQVYASEMTVLNIKEEKVPAKRKRYFLIALVCFSVFSLIVGAIRYHFAHQGAAASVPYIFLNPVTFAVFNMVFVVSAGLLVYYFFPSKDEMQRSRQVHKIKNDIKKANKVLKKKEAEYSQLAEQREDNAIISQKKRHDEAKLHEKIDANYDETVGTIKHENVIKRTDNVYPDCFSYPHQPLGGDIYEEFVSITE